MDIRQKLETLRSAAAKVDEKYNQKKAAQNKKKSRSFEVPLGFIEDESPEGKVFYRQIDYPLKHIHGGIYLREIPGAPADILSFIGQDSSFKNVDLKKTLYFDIETTGLAGGTGTVAFLAGAGFFNEETFSVRQYFMPDYEHEPAMLSHLNDLFEKYPYLVTFNGRTFDLPIIHTRMTMNRIRPKNSCPLHLDLLPPARRLWKATIGSCSLQSLERNILGITRVDDVPGYLIPHLYFNYLRDGNFKPIEGVFEHNIIDILSMTVLIVKMWAHLEEGSTGSLKPTEHCSLGKLYEDRCDISHAVEQYEKAIDLSCDRSTKKIVSMRIAQIHKKEGKLEEAAKIWQSIAEESTLDTEAHIELAKYYEHKIKDYEQAIKYAEQAFDIICRKKTLGSSLSAYTEQDEILKRILRLKKKSKSPG